MTQRHVSYHKIFLQQPFATCTVRRPVYQPKPFLVWQISNKASFRYSFITRCAHNRHNKTSHLTCLYNHNSCTVPQNCNSHIVVIVVKCLSTIIPTRLARYRFSQHECESRSCHDTKLSTTHVPTTLHALEIRSSNYFSLLFISR